MNASTTIICLWSMYIYLEWQAGKVVKENRLDMKSRIIISVASCLFASICTPLLGLGFLYLITQSFITLQGHPAARRLDMAGVATISMSGLFFQNGQFMIIIAAAICVALILLQRYLAENYGIALVNIAGMYAVLMQALVIAGGNPVETLFYASVCAVGTIALTVIYGLLVYRRCTPQVPAYVMLFGGYTGMSIAALLR